VLCWKSLTFSKRIFVSSLDSLTITTKSPILSAIRQKPFTFAFV
jgi:hypothetical protein